MHEALEKEVVGNAVMEVFSKPRVNGVAERLGIFPGAPLNLTGVDPDDGIPWDFDNEEKQKEQ